MTVLFPTLQFTTCWPPVTGTVMKYELPFHLNHRCLTFCSLKIKTFTNCLGEDVMNIFSNCSRIYVLWKQFDINFQVLHILRSRQVFRPYTLLSIRYNVVWPSAISRKDDLRCSGHFSCTDQHCVYCLQHVNCRIFVSLPFPLSPINEESGRLIQIVAIVGDGKRQAGGGKGKADSKDKKAGPRGGPGSPVKAGVSKEVCITTFN